MSSLVYMLADVSVSLPPEIIDQNRLFVTFSLTSSHCANFPTVTSSLSKKVFYNPVQLCTDKITTFAL